MYIVSSGLVTKTRIWQELDRTVTDNNQTAGHSHTHSEISQLPVWLSSIELNITAYDQLQPVLKLTFSFTLRDLLASILHSLDNMYRIIAPEAATKTECIVIQGMQEQILNQIGSFYLVDGKQC